MNYSASAQIVGESRTCSCPTDAIACKSCSRELARSSLGDTGGVGLILSVLLLISGIALLTMGPVFGWLPGCLLILCALFRGVGESRKVWTCGKRGKISGHH